MKAARRWWALASMALALGCSKPAAKKSGATRGHATASRAPEKPAAPPSVAPRDLDVEALERDLDCDKRGHAHACRIVKEFAQAQRFTAQTPSGTGRWIGPEVTVDKGKETTGHLVLWCKTVPTSQVGAGDLPVKAGYGLIPEGLKLQSEKLMRALTRAADPPESNPAYQFAHAFVPSTERVLARTSGASVHLTSEQSVYLRFAPPRKVYLVSPAGTNAAAGDGIYAELWLGDW
jgi:hypothetical protein